EWSRRRDLVLAGRASEALAGYPTTFADARGGLCEGTSESAVLAGVAELEAGDRASAVARVRGLTFELDPYKGSADPRLAFLEDARQNLWRSAGDLSRARSAAEEWLAADPGDALALDRLGEIAYLDGRFAEARARFAAAAGAASGLQRADELLKEGTALEMLGRTDDAIRVLGEVTRLAEPIRVRAAKQFEDQ